MGSGPLVRLPISPTNCPSVRPPVRVRVMGGRHQRAFWRTHGRSDQCHAPSSFWVTANASSAQPVGHSQARLIPTHPDSSRLVAIHCAQPIRRPGPPPPPPAAAAARSCFPIKTRGRQRRFSRPGDEMSRFLNAVKWRQEGKRFDPRTFFLVADVFCFVVVFSGQKQERIGKGKKKK